MYLEEAKVLFVIGRPAWLQKAGQGRPATATIAIMKKSKGRLGNLYLRNDNLIGED